MNKATNVEYMARLEKVVGHHLNKAAQDMSHLHGPVSNIEMITTLENIIKKIRGHDV